MQLEPSVEAFLRHAALERGLSPRTIETYGRELQAFLAFLGARGIRELAGLDRQQVLDFLAASEAAGLSARSRARRVVALRRWLRHLGAAGALARDPLEGVVAPRFDRTLPRTLRSDEAVALIEAAGGDSALGLGPIEDPEEVLAEVRAVGRYTVERWLVDSFFGNISYRVGDTIYISQTAASLDELSGCIDPVPSDNRSTTGITASSELLAHRRVYESTGARAILHGHPKFAVAISMLCEEKECPVKDCWKDCTRVRMLGDTPVVAGEIGAGGLAARVPPVIGGAGKAIVYGHGVFTVGRDGFEEVRSGRW